MSLYIKKNPNTQTLLAKTYAAECPPGYEPSTEADAQAWVDAQLAAGWTPAPLPEPAAAPRSVDASVLVLQRLTDAEVDALTAPDAPTAVKRAWLAATSEGFVSEAHPAFASMVAALDTHGVIAASRWSALLAP